MPGRTVLSALKHVWLTLDPFGVPMAVMGGIALAAWQHVRATQDVDILVGIGNTDIHLVLRKLAEAKCHPKRTPPILTIGELEIVQLIYQPVDVLVDIQVDLLLATSEYHRQALARRMPARLPDLDIEVFVLSCEDMVLHKLLAGRILDRVDAATLLRANRDSLDVAYLLKWVHKLQLQTELATIWEEAFPGESPPGTEKTT